MEASTTTASRVLEHLLEQTQPTTRPVVARALELSRPTVFAAFERLESLGIVEAVGQNTGSPGRSATLYEIARGAGLVGSVDIGGSNVRVAIADVRGQILATRREPTSPGGGASIVPQVISLLRAAHREIDASVRLTAITVSVPGVVDVEGHLVRFAANIDQFVPFDFQTPIEQAFSTLVQLENNVNLAAMGEQWRGAARGLGTFAVVSVGAGVGAGIVHEGQVIKGAHHAAGEIAYLPSHDTPARVDTSAHDEGGGIRLLEAAQAHAGWRRAAPSTVEELFERSATGEEPAVELIEDECRRIALAIASICAVIDPETVVLTGGVGSNRALITRVRELMDAYTLFPPAIVASDLAERASLIGALRMAAADAKSELLRLVNE
jgi:predicted NBD/HSP70 family sugar kinase